MQHLFHKISSKVSFIVGTPYAFLIAFLIIVIWGMSGPLFHFSDTWQLVINTGTTIVTFLMVFLIQNTQNRDGKEVHLKLDELIRTSHARNSFLDLDDVSDVELQGLDEEFHVLYEREIASDAMKKLHAKVQAEHKRRRGK